MKKLAVLFCGLLLCTCTAFAEETVVAEQVTDVDCAGFVGVINKQPENNVMKQTVKVRRSGFVLVININGKVEIPEKQQEK